MKKRIAGFATAFTIATGFYVGLLVELIAGGQDLFGILAYGIGVGACWILAMVGTYKLIFKKQGSGRYGVMAKKGTKIIRLPEREFVVHKKAVPPPPEAKVRDDGKETMSRKQDS